METLLVCVCVCVAGRASASLLTSLVLATLCHWWASGDLLVSLSFLQGTAGGDAAPPALPSTLRQAALDHQGVPRHTRAANLLTSR